MFPFRYAKINSVVKTAKCIMEQNLLFGYGDGGQN